MNPAIFTTALTLPHVLISMCALLSGAIMEYKMVRGREIDAWTTIFLGTALATSATGFLFRSASFGPPQAIGILSLGVLAVAFAALYRHRLLGRWRAVYIGSATFAPYLNAFVAVVQAFQKLTVLHALAPTQSESPFLIAQAILLAAFLALGFLSGKHFHPVLSDVAMAGG